MSDGHAVARAFRLIFSIAVLSLAVFAGIGSQFDGPDMAACFLNKGRTPGNSLNLPLPGRGTVTFQTFRNGAGGIILTNRPVDPSLPLAELKC